MSVFYSFYISCSALCAYWRGKSWWWYILPCNLAKYLNLSYIGPYICYPHSRLTSSPCCIYLAYSTVVPVGQTIRHRLAKQISIHCDRALILAVCTRVTSLPPWEKAFYLLFANKLGLLLVVQLSPCSNFTQALALLVSCHLTSFPIILFDSASAVLGRYKKGSANTRVPFPR